MLDVQEGVLFGGMFDPHTNESLYVSCIWDMVSEVAIYLIFRALRAYSMSLWLLFWGEGGHPDVLVRKKKELDKVKSKRLQHL